MVEIRVEDYPKRRSLLDEESRKKLPELHRNEDKGLEANALVKFFSPEGSLLWYAAAFDGEDLLYGLVVGTGIQLGYFSLSELEKAKDALGHNIERDLDYEPWSLQELIEFHGSDTSGKGDMGD